MLVTGTLVVKKNNKSQAIDLHHISVHKIREMFLFVQQMFLVTIWLWMEI